MVYWIIGIGIITISLVVLFLIQFYRDPKRIIPQGTVIVSPADGTIINIQRITSKKTTIKKPTGGSIETLASEISNDSYLISIFMSPFNAHINRAPIEGTITKTQYKKGKFFAAYDLKKSLQNEKNEIVIENKAIGKIKVIQIAGFLARRIFCFVSKGQKVNKGAKIGRIALSSQTTMIMPAKKITLMVKKGSKVKAGSSIIARYQ